MQFLPYLNLTQPSLSLPSIPQPYTTFPLPSFHTSILYNPPIKFFPSIPSFSLLPSSLNFLSSLPFLPSLSSLHNLALSTLNSFPHTHPSLSLKCLSVSTIPLNRRPSSLNTNFSLFRFQNTFITLSPPPLFFPSFIHYIPSLLPDPAPISNPLAICKKERVFLLENDIA